MFRSTLVAMAAVLALSAPSPAAIAVEGDPHILLTTSADNIELELDRQKVPVSMQDFVNYVNSGLYNNATFHRVIPDSMIQGSGLTEQVQQKRPNPPIKDEADSNSHDMCDAATMTHTADKGSTTNQLFISVADGAFLDHGQRNFSHAIFGKMVKDMGIVDKISQVPTHDIGPHQNVPSRPVVILSVEVLS